MSISNTSVSNIQIRNVFKEYEGDDSFVNSFPKDSIIQVELINGRKEGKGKVLSGEGILLAKLNFKNDKLNGNCLFLNEYGERLKEVNYENGVAEGLYCEFIKNSVSKMGIYKNGNVFSELRKHSKNSQYLEEVVNSKVISICKYSKEYKKDGLCTFYENNKVSSVVRFENGIEKEKKYEFHDGKMIEFDENGVVVYRGSYKGDAVEGFSRYGDGYCYKYLNGRVSRIDLIKKGVKRGYQLIGDVLKEYDAGGKLVYEGGFEGSAEEGFAWSGKGSEYLKDGIIVYGEFSNGKRVKTISEICKGKLIEYDNNRVIYTGEYSKESLKRSGKGQCFVYEGDQLKEVYHWENGEMTWKAIEFEDNTVIEYNENGDKIYQGDCKGDVRSEFVREGEGKEFANGILLYVGGWRNGMREGMGRSYKDNMVYYKGNWQNGVPNGEGELMNGFEVKYRGEWKNGLIAVEKGIGFDYVSGKMCGLYENGVKKYEGEMKNGIPDGRGVYYDKSGRVKYEGEWKNGRMNLTNGGVFDYQKENCILVNTDGVVFYEGELKDGIAHGSGQIVNKRGNPVFVGEWNEGVCRFQNINYVEIECGKVMIYERNRGLFGCGNQMKVKEWDGKSCIRISMTVKSSIELNNLSKMVSELIIAKNACNDMKDDLVISGFNKLRSIVVKKNAMQNLNSLKICDCDVLERIVVDGSRWDDRYCPFANVKSVVIASRIEVNFNYQDLPKLTTFTTGWGSFSSTTSVSFSSI